MTPDRMAALHALCFETPRPWRTEEFSSLLSLPSTILCSQEDGFVLGRLAGPEAEILTLAVAPTARRQGIGRQLVRSFLDRCKDAQAEEVHLELAAANDGARALYHACGFRVSGRRTGYYSAPDGTRGDAILMVFGIDQG